MERERRFSFGSYLYGYFVGALIVTATISSRDNSDERIAAAQRYNRQLNEQVAPEYPGLQSLEAENKKQAENKFTFSVCQPGEADKNCEGNYRVVNNVAATVGDIVCRVSNQASTTVTTLR